jgi:hypothetical protein
MRMLGDLPSGADKSATVEAHLALAREAQAAATHHADVAKATAAEVTALLQAASSHATETSALASVALESLRSAGQAATDGAARIEALRAQVEQAAQVAAVRSDHIEDGRKYVDERRAEIDVVLNGAREAASGAEAQLSAARNVADALSEIQASAQSIQAAMDAQQSACTAAREGVEEHAQTVKRLAQVADATEDRLHGFESRLGHLYESAERHSKVIDELLLGATNAGLASAFDVRSKMFKAPQRLWQTIFLGSLLSLLMLAAIEAWLFRTGSNSPDWQVLGRMFLHRLPFLLPLVWLAIHAARQASLAMRMEEEYAFKATISTSFEGYRRQMAEVSGGLTQDSPLARLCADTLATIPAPPGQVYDKNRMDPTPGTATADSIGPIVEGLKSVAAKLSDIKR